MIDLLTSMQSGFVIWLIIFPFLVAVSLVFAKNENTRRILTYSGCGFIIVSAILFAVSVLNGNVVELYKETHLIDTIMLIAEVLLMVLLIVLAFKFKKYYVALLSVVQTGLIAWLELTHKSHEPMNHIFVDKLSTIMCLMIAIVGSLICIYALGYMRGYHNHHKEYKDRRTFFMPMLFVFLGAMFGLVMSDNMIWIYFFWEITSISSFLLIGYTRTKEAINNSFRALWMNLLGGLGFAVAIVLSVLKLDIFNLSELISVKTDNICILVIILLAFAGLTKSAQLPFSRWLLGAMVAPTPTSALLHSATMVKAGVYLLLRLSPVFDNNVAGVMVSCIGGFTFLITSMLAITHSDAKKVLAYSTISNLGLIAACAGCGNEQTVWAGILLMIFHAISKSMLFQAVGAVENATGSRNIEDMHGLIKRLPGLGIIMVLGICGMFIAPFGMLISKWAALKSFIDSSNIILVCFICFGSATTLVYWAKWLCKVLTCIPDSKHVDDITTGGQWFSLCVHAVLMVSVCVSYPMISKNLLEPIVGAMFKIQSVSVLSVADMIITVVMLVVICAVPIIAKTLVDNTQMDVSLGYFSGINKGDNKRFDDSFHNEKRMYLAAWYLEDYFGEKKLWIPSVIISTGAILITIIMAIGGAF